MPLSLEGYGSKIQKVSRCKPTVSNGTILATKQVFFFTKVAHVQSITDIVLLDFLILLPFILSNTTFIKELIFFFECLHFSEYDMLMFLFVFFVEK